MKKLSALMAVLVLIATLFTGCGCTRQGAGMDTAPGTEMTILPTNIPETTAPVMPSTEPMTVAPTEVPSETGTEETGDGGSTDSMTGETNGTRNRIR